MQILPDFVDGVRQSTSEAYWYVLKFELVEEGDVPEE